MVAAITNGIKISVETEYQPEYSSPYNMHYVFIYKIIIENNSDYTVQLLRRKWQIFDTDSTIVREVEGDGVVGQQPILESGDSHAYVSGANLKSSIGKMQGFYTMERVLDGKIFEVAIPEFILIAPFRLN